ncbi:MAG: VPS10 domain-containing protein [Dehalococcoidia bacterium]
MPVEASLLQSLEWRSVGPFRGGRVVAVAGDPQDPLTFYFGGAAGGVWKSNDGGTYWQNCSDGFFNTAAIGALAVADSDPNVIYAGTGESCIRGDVSHGDGVYRSTDRGKSWKHLGLSDTRHIARIRIHPQNPDIVYVAALGHAFGPNLERGVFRSVDGGKNWEHILFRSQDAGAIDLCMDPNNPRILYAAIWEVRRTPWSLKSGGPGSGLFKSTDGGDTWTEISDSPGLPKGIKGRIGVAVSPAKAERVWAIVEAKESGLFRSDDGGASWQRLSQERDVQGRRWYYMHIFADPKDPETLWSLAGSCFKSVDGGSTFGQVPTPHGDNHDLWIDPRNPQRMIEGNDGGANVTYNGAASWSTIYNQPTAQFYHVATDTQFPYRLYATQQDNSAICVPSRTGKAAIPMGDCYTVGHAESGHIQVRPDDPNIVYSGAVGSSPGGGGAMLRYDHRTGQVRIITAWPEFYGGWAPKDLKYRFQWTYPILLSPHNPDILYATGNQVFRSTDEGTSWEVISPDLTRNDPSKLEASGGPLTLDTTGAEHYCTIFAFAESPHERGVLWAGSDDGLIHLSRDNGKTWENVTPPIMPEWATVNTIELSPHDRATAYAAATRYKLDDTRPYLYKTDDYGKSWREITNGIPEHDFTRVIREDPVRRGLLYAGTETGLYISYDGGGSWQRLQLNLPVVPVYDLQIKNDDLIAATHGRAFWILDDLTPVRQMAAAAAGSTPVLFKPRPTYRVRVEMRGGRASGTGLNYSGGMGGMSYYETKKPDGEVVRTFLDAGKNPADGVLVSYYLAEKPEGEVTLSFLDAAGNLIKSYSSNPQQGAQPQEEEASSLEEAEAEEATIPAEDTRASKAAGVNRFVWNMRYADAQKVPGDIPTERSLAGPLAPPGAYQVQLTVNGKTYSEPFEILKDPRVPATREDLDAQFELLLQIRDKLSQTHDAVKQLRSVRQQVGEWERRGARASNRDEIVQAARRLKQRLGAIEEELIQTRAKGESDRLNYPGRLNVKLVHLTSVVQSADGIPPRQTYEVLQELSSRIDSQLRELDQVLESEVPAFSDLVRKADVPAILATTTT